MKSVRTCLGCGQKFYRLELIRFALNSSNEVVCDKDGRGSGRGAYCCPNKVCLKMVFKSRKKLSRAFRREITGDYDIDTLLESGSFT